ncbi:hypothetical protein GBA65_21145 (plasmid) [Rubrobacter marinus]|uniref:Uncharacterized protein n=1 Tax=Rubrobacter marinus TaxID=2653852 RepID=A0A6G8Q3E5_9ACTN|nr:hypothetical protein [Rubrobacter marinus]QIN80968.1 hypothetical protein GBA65_21145 [Rubrobacter marinus]
MVGIYGLLAALGTSGLSLGARSAAPVWRGVSGTEAVALGLFGAALSLSMFALGELDFHIEGRDALFYPSLAGVLAAVSLMGAARYFGRAGAATAVALVYLLFRSSMLLVVWGMGSVEHLTPPVMVLAPALAIDLVLWRAGRNFGGGRVLAAALLAGPALLGGEWALRALFDFGGWEPLEVAASLAAVTIAVATGALAGDRLGSLLRGEHGPLPPRSRPVEDGVTRRPPLPSRSAASG